MFKQIFCRHKWADVNFGHVVRITVVSESGQELGNYYKIHTVCLKCKKLKTVQSGGNSGWSSPSSGSKSELFYKLLSKDIIVYEMNGDERTNLVP